MSNNTQLPAEVVEKILRSRDALVLGDRDEAYHQLYGIANPGYDSYFPWHEMEQQINYPEYSEMEIKNRRQVTEYATKLHQAQQEIESLTKQLKDHTGVSNENMKLLMQDNEKFRTLLEKFISRHEAGLLNALAEWKGEKEPAPAVQQSAVWVKARRGMKDGIYSMKCCCAISGNIMLGVGLVANGEIVLITYLNKSSYGKEDLPDNYEGILYLDESAGEKDSEQMKGLEWLCNPQIEFCYRHPDGRIEVRYRRIEGTPECDAMMKEVEQLIEKAKPETSPYFYRKEGEKEVTNG